MLNLEPIFIISLPRAGSTLLNRLLASHSMVASHAEPWLMLPLVYLSDRDAVRACYSHSATSRAINDIRRTLSDAGGDWQRHIGFFARGIYQELAVAAGKAQARYFIDKTPRYHLIVEHLAEIFPAAKFIVLARNPLACLASGIETWGKGRLVLHGQMIDLWEGPKNLAFAVKRLGTRAHLIRYEDLVREPEATQRELLRFLEVPYEPLHTNLEKKLMFGTMGDPTGVAKYGSYISQVSLEKYVQVLGTWYRRRFSLRYLERLDPDHVETMGYRYADIVMQAKALPSSIRGVIGDFSIHTIDTWWRWFDLGYARDRWRRSRSRNPLYIYN